jgi:hypothetical protein
MIIEFDKPVYEKVLGGIDQILSYDTETHKFHVKDCATAKKREHCTSLDCIYLSFSLNRDYDYYDLNCIKYLIDKGIKSFRRLPSQLEEYMNPTKESMIKLIELLDKVNSGELEVSTTEEDGHNYLEGEVAKKIEGLACDTLISSEGGCNWDNINILREKGYRVFPGEKDSFGWLTGCIKTNKGIIVYG